MSFFKNYYRALNSVGILNFQSDEVSGEAHFLAGYLGPLRDPVVLDIGANKGSYSLAARKVCPSSRIFAFEPHPTTFARLKAAVPSDVRVFNMGIGDAEGTFEFFDRADKDGSVHASLYKEVIERLHRRAAVSHQVSIRRLDDVVGELGIGHIALLKIDTEGHEMAVLRGAANTLSSGMVDVIQFEFNTTNVIARTFFKDFWDLLPDYNFYRLLPDNAIWIREYIATFCEVFAFQNIVCVRKSLSIFPGALETPRLS